MNAFQAVQAHLDNAAEIKRLQAENKALGVSIQTAMKETGVTFIPGTEDDHGLTLVESVRWVFPTQLAKDQLGEEWVTANSKQSLVRSLRLGRE